VRHSKARADRVELGVPLVYMLIHEQRRVVRNAVVACKINFEMASSSLIHLVIPGLIDTVAVSNSNKQKAGVRSDLRSALKLISQEKRIRSRSQFIRIRC